VKTVTSK